VVLPIGLQERVVAGVISAPRTRRSGGRQWAIAATVAATLIGGAVMWNVVRHPEAQPTVAVRNQENGLGVVSVEAAMVSGTGSLQDLTVEELEQLLGEIES
jgi:ABC-type glucose/galactose transport system permease subunit